MASWSVRLRTRYNKEGTRVWERHPSPGLGQVFRKGAPSAPPPPSQEGTDTRAHKLRQYGIQKIFLPYTKTTEFSLIFFEYHHYPIENPRFQFHYRYPVQGSTQDTFQIRKGANGARYLCSKILAVLCVLELSKS